MKIYILRKSLSDLKNPIIKNEYETYSLTVKDFISEMVSKNYNNKIKDSLNECINLALDEFVDGSYYIVNQTKNIKYTSIDEDLNIEEADEIVLIKLKYVRGIVW